MTEPISISECLANVRIAQSILTEAAPHARIAALAVLDNVARDLDLLAACAELSGTVATVDRIAIMRERDTLRAELSQIKQQYDYMCCEAARLEEQRDANAKLWEEVMEGVGVAQLRADLAKVTDERNALQSALTDEGIQHDTVAAENRRLRDGMARALDALNDALSDVVQLNAREARLRALGFEEPTDEQRRENLKRNVEALGDVVQRESETKQPEHKHQAYAKFSTIERDGCECGATREWRRDAEGRPLPLEWKDGKVKP
jgi:hypothetical protein